MNGLLLATVLATGAADVPDDVLERARALVETVLEGVQGAVNLRLFRTRAQMEAAVREVDPRVGADFAAWYHYRTRTIFAYMAPRPDADLCRGRLPGLLEGALVHEAFHARGALLDPRYRGRPAVELEGDAERDTVAFLRHGKGGGVPSAWELVIASRLARLAHGGAPPDPLGIGAAPPAEPAARAAWYALAFARSGGVVLPPPWVLFDGSAEPGPDGYRLVAAPGGPVLLVRAAPGPDLHVDVTPLDVGKGQVEVLFAFESRETYAKVAFLRRGGVRAMWKRDGRWTKDALAPAPPLPPGKTARLSLIDGVVSMNGSPVLYLQQPPGRVGIGVWDSAADLRTLRRG